MKRRPTASELRGAITVVLEDAKGENIVVIDLAGKSDIADFMVIASGRSERHLSAMTDRLLRRLKELGLGSAPVEGRASGEWILIDAGDVIVHLFRPEVRALYNLEKMWALALPREGAVSVGLSGGSGA